MLNLLQKLDDAVALCGRLVGEEYSGTSMYMGYMNTVEEAETAYKELIAMVEASADMAESHEAAADKTYPTDLSKRLRESADSTRLPLHYANLMRSAAAEIEVYYGGMLAWKRTAEAKDREFAAAMPGKVAEPVGYLVMKVRPYAHAGLPEDWQFMSVEDAENEMENVRRGRHGADSFKFRPLMDIQSHPAPQQEIEEVHALLSKYCVGETSNGIRVPLAERITELYQWYYAAIQPPAEQDAPAPQQAPAVQGQSDQAEFERQAKHQGAFDFTPARNGYCENDWFPATYRDAMVELAWRVWANKSSPAVPPSDVPASVDYRLLLAKYIEHVGMEEGVTFISRLKPEDGVYRSDRHSTEFSAEEYAALLECDDLKAVIASSQQDGKEPK